MPRASPPAGLPAAYGTAACARLAQTLPPQTPPRLGLGQGQEQPGAGKAGDKDGGSGFVPGRPDAPPTVIEDSPDYLPPNSYAPARVASSSKV